MQNKKAYELVTTDAAEKSRHSPHDGFNRLPRALPGDQDLLTPSLDGQESASLTPTSRRQDHTLSPSASAPFVKGASTSTASRPAFVTIASRPLSGTGRRDYNLKIRRMSSDIL
jgi:hypothetical protein